MKNVVDECIRLVTWGRIRSAVVALGLLTACSSDVGPGGPDAGVGTKRIEEPLTAGEWPTETIVATNSIWLQDRTDVIGAVAVTKAASMS